MFVFQCQASVKFFSCIEHVCLYDFLRSLTSRSEELSVLCNPRLSIHKSIICFVLCFVVDADFPLARLHLAKKSLPFVLFLNIVKSNVSTYTSFQTFRDVYMWENNHYNGMCKQIRRLQILTWFGCTELSHLVLKFWWKLCNHDFTLKTFF